MLLLIMGISVEWGIQVTIQQLHNFVTVAECGSINSASERLFISQQALRLSISSFEKKLGITLFIRTPRGTRLTEQGQAILEDAKRILSIVDGWQIHATQPLIEAETVEVLASTVVCNTVLTDVIKECHISYPALNIRLFHTRDDEMIATIGKNAIGVIGSAPTDIVSGKLRPFALKQNYAFDTFGEDYFYIYLNTSNPLVKKEYLTTDDLSELTLAAYPGEDSHFYYRHIHSYFKKPGAFFIEKQESIFQIIAEMEDVAAVFPRMAISNNSYVERGLITAMPVKNYSMPGVSCMLYPKPNKITPGQRLVAEMIRQRLEELLQQLNKS